MDLTWGEPVRESCSKADEAGEYSAFTLPKSRGCRLWEDCPPPPAGPPDPPPTTPAPPVVGVSSRGSLRSSKPSLRISWMSS